MNKGLMVLAPVSVLVIVVLLAVMYGWVGDGNLVGGEGRETPEGGAVAGNVKLMNGQVFPAGIGDGQLRLIHEPVMPMGVGNGQIQLINEPAISTGIGKSQIQLIDSPAVQAGIGNGQIRLINEPPIPIGLGKQAIVPIHHPPPFSAGIGDGRIQLIAQNQEAGPYLGLRLGEVPEAVAVQQKLAPETGVYIRQVLSGSPAERAGLQKGDVVLECDRKAVNAHESIGFILSTKKVGEAVKLLVDRNGRKLTFHVELEQRPVGVMLVGAAVPKKVWIGADIQDVDAVMQLQFRLPDKKGAIISHVAANSPAEAAGLQAGDVVISFDGTDVKDVTRLQALILKKQPGDQAALTVLRNGAVLNLQMQMGQWDPNREKAAFLEPADIAVEGSWIGMDVVELGPEGAADLGLPQGTTGVLVTDVEGPPASIVGFQSGDVIMAINGQPTPDMKQFEAASRTQQQAVVDVIRGNRHRFISVPPPGFTQQGARIDMGTNAGVKKVAVTMPAEGRLGILAAGPHLNSSIAGDVGQAHHLIAVDLRANSYTVLGPEMFFNLADATRRLGIGQVVCGSLAPKTAFELAAGGVSVFSGVVGTANTAISLYESGSLTSMRVM